MKESNTSGNPNEGSTLNRVTRRVTLMRVGHKRKYLILEVLNTLSNLNEGSTPN